jgi:S1-C subfamily serine protease
MGYTLSAMCDPRRTLPLLALTLACSHPGEVARLQAENAALQAQVEELTARVADLEHRAALATPEPAPPVIPDPPAWLVQDGTGGWAVRKGASPAIEDLATSARAILHRGATGEHDGFRVSAIRRGTALDLLGFDNGDVVHAVNGRPVTSVEQAMDAYASLHDAAQWRFDITRRGEQISLLVPVQ